MQKKIIALAIAAAFAAPAAAMAEATFYGSMDGGLRHQTNDNTGVYDAKPMVVDPATGAMVANTAYNPGGGGTTDSMKMGQYNTARWGFKMVEDMGDGLKTNVVLETSIAPGGVGGNPDMTAGAGGVVPSTGAAVSTQNATNPFGLIFDRQATIGLEGGLGKFDMGWNYSTSFKTVCSYDAFACKYLGVTGAPTSAASVRNGGMQVGMKFGDIAVNAEYMMNDAFQTRQSAYAAAGRALGVSYAADGFNAGFAYTTQEATIKNPATGSAFGYDNAMTHVTAGAGYNFGDGKVNVGYAKKTTKTNPDTTADDSTQTDMWVGASYNLSSAVALTAAYYSRAGNTGVAEAVDSTKKTMMVGATYALSKKTNLYLEMDRAVANDGLPALVGSMQGEDFTTIGTSAGLSTVF